MGDKKIIKQQCGEYSSAVLSADGEVTVWGHTEIAFDRENCHLPRAIKIEQKVVDISMSERLFFLLALTVDNRLYAVGENVNGQCGEGHESQNSTSVDFKEQPVQVKNLQHLRIKQISAGEGHCLVICTKI